MYCGQCGKVVPNPAKFCPSCGAAVAAETAVSAQGQEPSPSATPAPVASDEVVAAHGSIAHKGFRLLSYVVYGLGAALALLVVFVILTERKSPSAPQPQVAAPKQPSDGILREEALNQILKSKFSLASAGGLCDKVEDAKLADVQVGTISKTDLTGNLAKPLPAIVARHDYVCVMSAFGKKERQPDQWVILAVDSEFSMVRCLRTGPKQIIDQLKDDCGFKP